MASPHIPAGLIGNKFDLDKDGENEKMEELDGNGHGVNGLAEKLEDRLIIQEKFIGRWKWMEGSGDCNEYHKQFGDGFFYWMAVRWFMAFEIDGANWKWIRQDWFENFLSYREFVLDEEFEGVVGGSKCKVLIKIDGEKFVGKEIREDGKISNGEIIIDADGNLLVMMESDGVKCTEKYKKMEE